MKHAAYFACAILAVALPGSATAANMCQADGGLTCATTMPLDGYCECTAHRSTQPGTVVPMPRRGVRFNATAGGCGADPNSPGCRGETRGPAR